MSDPEEPFGPARPDARTRVRRVGSALAAQVRALFVPDRGVPALVSAGRARMSMVIVIAAALLAAAAVSARIDMAPSVRAQNAGGPGPGPAGPRGPGGAAQPPGEDKTDRDIADEIDKQTAIVEVKTWLDAALGTPGRIFGLALALLLLGRYIGGKPTFQRALAAAAVGALPWAARSLIEAAAAWRQASIGPGDLGHLVAGLPVPLDNPLLARLASVDVFSLWSLLLCGFGLAAAAGITRRRAFVAVTVAYLLLLFLLSSLGAP